MNIKISNLILDSFKLKDHEFLLDTLMYDNLSGFNEYRLYSYLTTFFNDITILDVGTLTGRSAVSLSYNDTNNVISYDIINYIPHDHIMRSKSNIEFKIGNVLRELTKESIEKIKIIMIDADHKYNVEKSILDRLRELNYSGLVILDDIHHHKEPDKSCMDRLWNEITEKKYDVTKYGHDTGTGIVVMGNFDCNIVLE